VSREALPAHAGSGNKEGDVTEADWLTETDPQLMLAFLHGRARHRTLRLFAAACCRRVWHLLPDERSRLAVVVVEQFAEGLATPEEMSQAAALAEAAAAELDDAYFWGTREQAAIVKAAQAASAAAGTLRDGRPSRLAAEALGHVTGAAAAEEDRAFKAWAAARGTPRVEDAWLAFAAEGERARSAEQAAVKAELANHCQLLRDLFGDPFRPAPAVEPGWLSWFGGIVPRLAQEIYGEGRFDRLPVLADALTEARCQDDTILGHLRGPGPHVRGCWAVDLLLARE
jgi:hypothetical protein